MATQFGEDYGLVHEAIVTGRKVGAGKEFWAGIAHNEALFAKVVALVAGALRVVFTLIAEIERDMTGWECLASTEAEPGEFEPELQEFLQKGECYTSGEEMIRRATEKEVFSGLRHAEAMLRNQEKIPVEWRKFVLVFPEVWQYPYSNRRVWYLFWDGERWYLSCHWLSNDFSSIYRLVRPRNKYQKSLDT
ncbi:MAG: hypothetical protein Q8Q48_02685 [Candidatus Staskawiczbacteria bacterium]|nr:hypothetical protein [Candidatus Staskawiczbacteria bacterium]